MFNHLQKAQGDLREYALLVDSILKENVTILSELEGYKKIKVLRKEK